MNALTFLVIALCVFTLAYQLLATTALAIGTTIIMRNNRKKLYGLITFIGNRA